MAKDETCKKINVTVIHSKERRWNSKTGEFIKQKGRPKMSWILSISIEGKGNSTTEIPANVARNLINRLCLEENAKGYFTFNHDAI